MTALSDDDRKIIEDFDKHIKQVEKMAGGLVFSTSFRTVDNYSLRLRSIISSLQQEIERLEVKDGRNENITDK